MKKKFTTLLGLLFLIAGMQFIMAPQSSLIGQTYRILVRRGLAADLPALAAGEFGFSTDTKELHIGSSVGNLRVMGDYITPEMYGAKGDGATDDRAAIQAAITAIISAGSGRVVFSAKTYAVASTITVNCGAGKSVILCGSGKEGTSIKWIGAANGTVVDWENTSGGAIKDIIIDGNDLAGIGIIIHGTTVQPQGNSFDTIQVQKVTGTPGYGIQLGSSAAGEYGPTANHFSNVWLYLNTTGIYQDHNQTVDNGYEQVYFASNTAYGFYGVNGSAWFNQSAAIDDGTADFYFGPDMYWVSLNDVEVENTGGISAIFADGSRAWPTHLRDFRATQGSSGVDIFRYLQGGQLTMENCHFTGANGTANNVVITSHDPPLIISGIFINCDVSRSATWVLTGVKEAWIVDGYMKLSGVGSGYITDTQYRVDRRGSGYGRVGFYNNDSLEAAVGEDAAALGSIKLYAKPSGGSLTEVFAVSGDGNADLIGHMTIASGKQYYISSTPVVNQDVTTTAGPTFDHLHLTTGPITVAGTQVVGARVVDARADDVANSGDATTDGLIDALRDAMIAHGLIAAA